MPTFNTFVSICGGVTAPFLLAGTLMAQTATDSSNTTENGLALGEVVTDTRQVGDTYIQETIADWSLRCIQAAAGENPCQMYQLLSDESGSPVAEFTMLRLPEGQQAVGAATIVVPLETALQRGLSIKVDDGPSKSYPYAFCNTIGCYARIGLTAEDVDSYKRGGQAVLTIIPVTAPDQQVNVTLSLNGFTAAFDAASVLEN